MLIPDSNIVRKGEKILFTYSLCTVHNFVSHGLSPAIALPPSYKALNIVAFPNREGALVPLNILFASFSTVFSRDSNQTYMYIGIPALVIPACFNTTSDLYLCYRKTFFPAKKFLCFIVCNNKKILLQTAFFLLCNYCDY